MGKLIKTRISGGGEANAFCCGNECSDECKFGTTIHEKWLIEIWDKGKLQDIIETPYDTEPLASIECARKLDEQQKDNQSLLDNYAERLEAFVMDETTEDREPVEIPPYTFKYIAKKYLVTMLPDGRYRQLIYEF